MSGSQVDPHPRLEMSSEDRQKVRMKLLEEIAKAEAEFYAYRETARAQRAKTLVVEEELDAKRVVLVKWQNELRGFLMDPGSQ